MEFGRGFGFNVGSSASLLVGRDETRTKQSSENDEAVSRSTRVVPIIDMELTLVYEKMFGSLSTSFRVGDQAEWWSNGPDHFRAFSTTAVPPPGGEDYLFFGPFAELKVKW